MSNPDDPERPHEPRPTEAWDPDDLPPRDRDRDEDEDGAEDGGAEAEPPDPGARHEGTLVISPELVEELRDAPGEEAPAGDAGGERDAVDTDGGDAAASPEEEDPDADDSDPLVGQLIKDKWRVLERIGAGSFGTV